MSRQDAQARPDLHVKGTAPMYLSTDVVAGQRWQHYRGGVYTTIGLARLSTNGPDEGSFVVVYKNDHSELCVRDAAEFLDGRFQRLDGELNNEG